MVEDKEAKQKNAILEAMVHKLQAQLNEVAEQAEAKGDSLQGSGGAAGGLAGADPVVVQKLEARVQ